MKHDHIVFLIDDDDQLRESVLDLFGSVGMHAVGLGSITDYLLLSRPALPGCILLDIELPGVSGLEFQSEMVAREHPPIVFITGHGDVTSSVRAMKSGAVDFLIKPFLERDLLAATRAAIALDTRRRAEQEDLSLLRTRFEDLTQREREVFPLVVSGLLNKQAAAELGISEVTYQIHRSKVMQKMRAASFADLVRIAIKLDIPVTHFRHASAATR